MTPTRRSSSAILSRNAKTKLQVMATALYVLMYWKIDVRGGRAATASYASQQSFFSVREETRSGEESVGLLGCTPRSRSG
jgi:hypothetical protein